MKHSNRYSPELRDRTVRLVLNPQGGHETQWVAIVSVSSKVGLFGRDASQMGPSSRARFGRSPWADERRERLKALERENLEHRRANEILRKASAYFAQAELDRRPKT